MANDSFKVNFISRYRTEIDYTSFSIRILCTRQQVMGNVIPFPRNTERSLLCDDIAKMSDLISFFYPHYLCNFILTGYNNFKMSHSHISSYIDFLLHNIIEDDSYILTQVSIINRESVIVKN